MKYAQQIRRQPPSCSHPLPVETVSPRPPASPNWFLRLTLGGAICGSFAGSFAGALLGAVIGAFSQDISLGLDGALIGGGIAAVAGAVYGLFLACRENRNPLSSSLDANSSPNPFG